MMAATRAGHHLIDRLPTVRGALRADAGLGRGTWFGVGGAADVLFQPADAADLSAFLAELPAEVPVSVLGVGSNLLVRDGGVAGVVVRLGRGFAGIRADGTEIVAGAAASDIHLAVAAADIGIGGLEFLRGIPGSVGGAVRMNAGAYDREVADVLVEACAIDRAGRRHRVGPRELGYAYRHSAAPADWIFVAARLAGRAAQPAKVHALMTEIAARREASQPIRTRTGGSTFANPPGEKAWTLIDAAGWKLSQVSMGTGLLPEISLSVDFVRQLNAGERAALDAKLAQAGRIENGVVEILLDAAQSPFATRTDGFRLSGLEIEVGVLPKVTWLLANDG